MKFKDTTGRAWDVEITVGAARRVKAMVGEDLLQIEQGKPPLLTRLGLDLILLIDVIFALVKPQADADGITDEQFADALGPDAALQAQEAFFASLAAFFRSLNRPERAAAVERQAELIQAASAKLTEQIQQIDVNQLVDNALAEAQGGKAQGMEVTARAQETAPTRRSQ